MPTPPADACLIAHCVVCFPGCYAAALEASIAEGVLLGPVEAVTVAARQPPRQALLAAMQQHDIKLPFYDIVVATTRGGGVGAVSIPLEELWPQLQDAGGITQVGGNSFNGAGDVVACVAFCGLFARAAAAAAAAAL